jgi:uncharacterized iron-regulated membrane protein
MNRPQAKNSAIRAARALNAHSLVAVIFGALIYVLAVTGTLSVFNHELQRWEQPGAPEMTRIAPEAAERAALSVFESEAMPSTHLYINLPQEDLPRTVITTDTQAFFARQDGTVAGPESFPWTQFLLDLHYYLHLHSTLGLTVVGSLGALLVMLSISGLLAHPRIFRDAFRFRRGAGRLTMIDLHNRLGVWTIPFHFSNALTGAILGLASVLALGIAAAGFGGDTDAVFDPVFGAEPEAAEGVAEVADIDGPLAFMAREYPDLAVTHFILHDPASAGQHSEIVAEHPDRLIFGDYYTFDASGAYRGNVGISDGTIGQQVTGSVYNVHFGNWGGLPVKLAYLVFGLALCLIVASGMTIYFARKEANGRPAPRLAGAWQGVVWGTPAMLAVTLAASLLGVGGGVLVALFWLGLAGLCAACAASGARAGRRLGQAAALSGLAAGLAIYHFRFAQTALSDAGLPISAALGFACAALAGLLVADRRKPRPAAKDRPAAEVVPAE